MTQAKIVGLGTAEPAYQFAQMDIYNDLAPALNNRRAPMIFRAAEVDTRFSVLEDPKWLVTNPTNEERLNLYNVEAPALGRKAVEKALQNARLTVADIDHFIAVSCTGVDCPGIDLTIAYSMGMSPYLRRTAIVGMGCHALMPALHQAKTIIAANPNAKIVVLTVELCTLHFQHDSGLRNILGSALFGDGASAVVVSNGNSDGISLIDSLSYSDYMTQGELAFNPGNHGYKINLTTRIPDKLRIQVPPLVEQILSRNNLQLSNIKHWVVHPGGMKILEYIEQALELDNNEMQYAKAVLKKHGNLSSATLLFVLERLVQEANPAPGDYGIMLGFGPGLTIEVGLIQW